MNREVFDRSATCVALTPTRESYVGPELPPDAGIHARKQQAETLGGSGFWYLGVATSNLSDHLTFTGGL